MNLHTLQDRLAAIATAHGNIDVVLIDPTQEIGATDAHWTNAIGLHVTASAQTDDGDMATVLMLIPNPDNAMTVDGDGNVTPLFGAGEDA